MVREMKPKKGDSRDRSYGTGGASPTPAGHLCASGRGPAGQGAPAGTCSPGNCRPQSHQLLQPLTARAVMPQPEHGTSQGKGSLSPKGQFEVTLPQQVSPWQRL